MRCSSSASGNLGCALRFDTRTVGHYSLRRGRAGDLWEGEVAGSNPAIGFGRCSSDGRAL